MEKYGGDGGWVGERGCGEGGVRVFEGRDDMKGDTWKDAAEQGRLCLEAN